MLVIFDLGGVLTTPEVIRIPDVVEERTGIAGIKQAFMEHVESITKGETTIREVYTAFLREQHPDQNPEAALQAHRDIYRELVVQTHQHVIGLIDELRQKHRVVYLTNAEPDVFPIAVETGLIEQFTKGYASYDIHMKKPDKEIFDYVLKEEGYKPEEAVFIDDAEPNVQAAAALGIKAIQYVENMDLREALQKKGVSF